MQFSSSVVLFLSALASVATASRSATIRAGMAVVGNQAHDDYYAADRARTAAKAAGDNEGRRNAGIAKYNALSVNSAMDRTVDGVRQIPRNPPRNRARSLEFLGSDDTHEYFARSLVDDEFDEYYY